MEKQTKWMRGIVIGLLVSSALVSVIPAQASSRHWDPSDARGLDIRRVKTYVLTGNMWIKVRMYERWLGPGFNGAGDYVLFRFDISDQRVDYRYTMRNDARGFPRCFVFRGHEPLHRLYAFGENGGHSMSCDGYHLPGFDPDARWRVVAFDDQEVTDRAPNHGWYRGL